LACVKRDWRECPDKRYTPYIWNSKQSEVLHCFSLDDFLLLLGTSQTTIWRGPP
jgi:hypothetical protein